MSFEVDRYSSSWAHIALCADLTWAAEPPDDFVITNQRLLANHCRISQVLHDSISESQNSLTNNQCELTDNKQSISRQNIENGNNGGRKSVKDVIPESRLAQYGNFYYDDVREKCYTNCNEREHLRGSNNQGCENSDLTECWMLPEVEYWFRKLLNDSTDRGIMPRRRRQCRMLPDEDFGRCGPSGSRTSGEEAALAARVLSVKSLWATRPARAPSPLPLPRKMRARRRQPRRLSLAPPPPAYCLEVPAQLCCDPTCKIQFDSPSPPQGRECQRAMSRLSASVQAVMRAARCPPYRGTNVSRYAPTGQRPASCADRKYARMVWWPRENLSPRFQANHIQQNNTPKTSPRTESEEKKTEIIPKNNTTNEQIVAKSIEPDKSPEKLDSPKQQKNIATDQQPSTSAAAMDASLRKKRLYSTVLSMSAPAPISLAQIGCVRLAQKLVTPGLIKLSPKIVLTSARVRPPNVDHKFEELEKEALEQYKASDESIDTKFRELEKQAVEQYNTSNSNTSCSSGNSAEKKKSNSSTENETKNKPAKFHKEKPVDSVVIYSQNFPDLNSKTSSAMNLKNFHGPPRGEKKENHRQNKSRNKGEQRAASDTDYEARETNFKNHKGPMRWTLHVVPPKKRHLAQCVSDFSSDEDMGNSNLHARSIKDAAPRIKSCIAAKMKMSAHGGGDLHPIMRKT
ncbi:hypothetical protein K1T71_012993 [Dendrolimus kikuchii]|uniref:Uncharacterized protein n=1 Tax=Dendrolimus kikuchii TaxID=765133 RepID=A0ACC1CIQ1_9NEOP|nr:hypothetical protein K1T71_012993 [Dendrolimus kikuchii]